LFAARNAVAKCACLESEPENSKRDLYTFECEKCDRVEVRGVRVL